MSNLRKILINTAFRKPVFFIQIFTCKENTCEYYRRSFRGKRERSSVVELHLAKVNVVSSNLIARSIFKPDLLMQIGFYFCSELQYHADLAILFRTMAPR